MTLTRIYQGRINSVEICEGKDENNHQKWKAMPNWQDALWKHHCLFQDAVNYYTLMLAALAYEIRTNNEEKPKIIHDWAKQVELTWEHATKKSKDFEGPHKRISKIMGLDPEKSKFKDCVEKILENCNPNAQIRAAALIQLLEEAKGAKLNQVAGDRLSWLCYDKLNAGTSKDKAIQKENTKKAILAIHEAKNDTALEEAVKLLDPYNFLTKYPGKKLSEKESCKLAVEKFDKLCEKDENKDLIPLRDTFLKKAEDFCSKNALLAQGRKPKGVFPYAIVLKVMPDMRIAEKFKRITSVLFKEFSKSSSDTNSSRKSENDPKKDFEKLCENKNPFEFFSNIVMKKGKNKSSWFEFDKMAFIEAINYPHRFYDDTLERNKAAKEIEEKISAMESRGMRLASDDEQEDDHYIPGFSGDKRISLIRKLVTVNLGHLAEVEGTESTGKIEYSIDAGTMRGFRKIREKWLKKISGKSEPTEDELRKIVAEEQAAHRDDFGSAPLFNELAKKEFWPIWRENGTEDYHAKDAIKAWMQYNEFKEDLEHKRRPIGFTHAHPSHSPRYFDFTKENDGQRKVRHEKNSLRFTAGVAIEENGIYNPTVLRFTYSAPRLLRDHLRSDNEDSLSEATWLQPMMEALGFGHQDADHANFANAKISLMAKALDNFQIVFPISVETEKLYNTVSTKDWSGQFRWGGNETLASLLWHTDKPKHPPDKFWNEKFDKFSCLSVDLGQRTAAAVARIEAQSSRPEGPCRFIGNNGEKDWFARIVRTKMLRLPGEDQETWRQKSKLDHQDSETFSFREELFGSKGRSSTKQENDQAKGILKRLDIAEDQIMPDDWHRTLSFPEQNDRLLLAVKRAQYRIACLHRWAFFLDDPKKKDAALNEIKDSEDDNLTSLLNDEDKLKEKIRSLIVNKQDLLTSCLVDMANRILPLRGRSWIWKKDCFRLAQEGSPLPNVMIRGQRGLSIARIEQISELRKRLQSMNKTLRRNIGEKARAGRDESIPDCCPDILEKLDHIKEQRVNQTAHMILAEALGIHLAQPDSSDEYPNNDRHGSYEKILGKNGIWIGPVDFLVIEDLSRYSTTQGRSRRENSRLMKWCHRAIRDKLKEMMKVFFRPAAKFKSKEIPPLLETPAAYSSRFCSRSGVAGFRAFELAPGFHKQSPWRWMLEKESKNDGLEAKPLSKLLQDIQKINSDNPKIPRTLLAPVAGGPIFVPASDNSSGTGILSPKIAQADINAAINLGLRAIASPLVWEIHPRLRSKREKGDLFANEKRKFGDRKSVRINSDDNDKSDDRNPNFFADFGKIAAWGKSSVEGHESLPLVSGKAMWSSVNEIQWSRCDAINRRRMIKWENEKEKLPE